MTIIKTRKIITFGSISGFLNGLFGAGGGMVVVPSIRKELGTKSAHATSIAIILPMSIASSVNYIIKGYVTIQTALPYIPFGIIGALSGIMIMKKVKPKVIKKVFAFVMLWAGIKMVFL